MFYDTYVCIECIDFSAQFRRLHRGVRNEYFRLMEQCHDSIDNEMSDKQNVEQKNDTQKSDQSSVEYPQNNQIASQENVDTNSPSKTNPYKAVPIKSGNFTERSHSLPNQQLPTPFASESGNDFQTNLEKNNLASTQSDSLTRRFTRSNNSKDHWPNSGVRSEQGFRNYQEDRYVERIGFYNTKTSYKAPRQIIPMGLQKYSGLLKESSKDYSKVHQGEPKSNSFHYFAVFDGHGGDLTSTFCEEHMAGILEDQLKLNLSDIYNITSVELAVDLSHSEIGGEMYEPEDLEPVISNAQQNDQVQMLVEAKENICTESKKSGFDDEPEDNVTNALKQAFIRTDELFSQQATADADICGSTALVMLLSVNSIYVGNVGDSRAVLCRNGEALPLSDDHKADRADEQLRVEQLGGQVLHFNGMRVMGVLAMSRAIGDAQLKPFISPEPEVTVVHRKKSDQLVIMASDGLWDVFDNQEACALALRCLHRAGLRGQDRRTATRLAANVLAKTAISRGSRDNVTVLVVDLKPSDQSFTLEEVQSAAERYKEKKEQEDQQIRQSTDVNLRPQTDTGEGTERVPPSPFLVMHQQSKT
eukprot:TRINITY_DN1869_c0_g1_i1.p1 TRINITY_DN1869_c0_g1~~TRINITY_DN1869_c0_g1_i1.p1  ORF type:complete len:587 (-),score=76.36 TRINITY_DN1869_c0_g1_i1:122-1882(-)